MGPTIRDEGCHPREGFRGSPIRRNKGCMVREFIGGGQAIVGRDVWRKKHSISVVDVREASRRSFQKNRIVAGYLDGWNEAKHDEKRKG